MPGYFSTLPDPTLIQMSEDIRACSACTIRQEAIAPVPGVGRKTGILFVGLSPGDQEDIQGKPFVGPSGEVLSGFLSQCGLTRNDIFLSNLVLCHPYANRHPDKDEVRTCVSLHLKPYLDYLKPYFVVTLGALAAKYIGGVRSNITKIHGKLYFHKAGFWYMPCLHPGSVLYMPLAMKAELDFDATQIKEFLDDRSSYIREWEVRCARTS